MNGEEEEEHPKVVWGTAGLKRGFTGIIRDAKIQKSERTFRDERTGEEKEARDQLVLTIEPTDFQVPPERWIKSYYSLSNSVRSKWAELQEALEKCGALPKESEQELIGLEFEFERKTLEFGKRRDGTKIIVEDAILPKRLIRDTKKPAKAEPSKESKEEEIDIESLILEAVEKEPVKLDDFLAAVTKQYKLKRAEVFKKVMDLKKRGLVKYSDDGILTIMQ